MQELFGQLGINLSMLLAQAFNFAVLLSVLTIFVYKPLIKTIKIRSQKIEDGLRGADLVEIKLKEIDSLGQEKLKVVDKEGQELIKKFEQKANLRANEIVSLATQKGDSLLAEAGLIADRKKIEEFNKLTKEAKNLVRQTIEKVVELDPRLIDEKLIDQTINKMKE